jgi:periplasmic protein TonB
LKQFSVTSKPIIMNGEQIMKSDVIDIIFENKNKAYGAYNLRKFYDRRLNKALLIMLAMVVVLSAFTFLPEKKTRDEDKTYTYTTTTLGEAEKKKEEKPQEKPKPKTQNVPQAKLLANIIITKTGPVDTVKTIDSNIAIGSRNITVPNPGKEDTLTVGSTPGPGDGGGGGGGEPVKPKIPELPVFDPSIPVDNADVQPEFPGGMNKLRTFLQNNLTNPKDMEEGEMVSVKIKFVVGYDGKLKSFETIEDGGSEFNREVIRVLKKMPEWVPGKSNGRNVSVYYTIPVKFTPAE